MQITREPSPHICIYWICTLAHRHSNNNSQLVGFSFAFRFYKRKYTEPTSFEAFLFQFCQYVSFNFYSVDRVLFYCKSWERAFTNAESVFYALKRWKSALLHRLLLILPIQPWARHRPRLARILRVFLFLIRTSRANSLSERFLAAAAAYVGDPRSQIHRSQTPDPPTTRDSNFYQLLSK